MTSESCAFVYVATGTAYLGEALRSATTLRALHPQHAIWLVTDHPPSDPGPFTAIHRPAGPVEHGPIDKLLAFEIPAERIVFLDTDTHVLGDLRPIFELLDRFDFALVQDVNRGWNYTLDGLAPAFTEFNTGVVAFRKSAAMATFFADWRANFVRLRPTLEAQGQPSAADQPAFRYTLYRSALRVAPLPNEYHFLCDYPNSTMWQVRLLHGRSDYRRVAAQINAAPGLRSYVPDLGVPPSFAGRLRLLRGLIRFNLRALAVLLRGGENVVENHPRKWWLAPRPPPPPAP